MVSGLAVSTKRKLASITALSSKEDGDHPTKSSNRVLDELRREIRDLRTALTLDQDDAGTLPKSGSIGCGTVKHKPMSPEIEDFAAIEFQTGQTTGTGQLVLK